MAEKRKEKKKKSSLLDIIKNTIIPGQMAESLLGSVNEEIVKGTKQK